MMDLHDLDRQYRRHPERAHPVALADRHILAKFEPLVSQMVSSLVVFITLDVIVERLASARPMDEMTDFIVLIAPETNDAAGIAMSLPNLRIDSVFGIERCDDRVAVSRASGQMAGLARKFQTDLPETARQGDAGEGGLPDGVAHCHGWSRSGV
jgi:hypothetical protein